MQKLKSINVLSSISNTKFVLSGEAYQQGLNSARSAQPITLEMSSKNKRKEYYLAFYCAAAIFL